MPKWRSFGLSGGRRPIKPAETRCSPSMAALRRRPVDEGLGGRYRPPPFAFEAGIYANWGQTKLPQSDLANLPAGREGDCSDPSLEPVATHFFKQARTQHPTYER